MSASAFCRSTTAPRLAGVCPEPCITEGLPLAWQYPYATYTLNERGFPDLDEATVRQVLGRSFAQWNNITCNTETGSVPIGLDVQSDGKTTSLEVGPDGDEPNQNVIVYIDGDSWTEQGLSEAAFALTAVWYDRNDGEILGADMHFNGGMGRLTICPDEGCAVGDVDLENVTTHEIGHFIGLAHSSTEGSTMWCSANVSETEKRTLGEDDIAGACAAYPPGAFRAGPRTARGSCALAVPSPDTSYLWLLALGLLGLVARARRTR